MAASIQSTGTNPNGNETGRRRTFAQALAGTLLEATPRQAYAHPKVIGGNLAVLIDEEEYNKGVADFIYNLIGRLILSKGDAPIKTNELKATLSAIWAIKEDSWKITPLGRDYFDVHLSTATDKTKVFSMGAVFLKPGVL